jgi:hypothetical protein
MKKPMLILASALIALGLLPAQAQFGPRGGGMSGPNFGGATGKLFGEHKAFNASMEMHATDASGNTVTMPGKLSFNAGKSRFEMNMADVKGSKMSPNAAAQMKSMGLDQIVAISRPDKKVSYTIYPGMKSYVENKPTETAPVANPDDYKAEVTELGKETVDGHPCVKNKVVVTDKANVKHESTVWNATDLKQFPVKIETHEQGGDAIMLFKDISLDKPADANFEIPDGFTKYDNMQTMMQTEMMKKMGGGGFGR